MEQKDHKKKIIAIVSVAVVAVLLIGYLTTVYAAKPDEGEEDSLLREYPVSRGDITAGTDGSGALLMDGQPQSFDTAVKLEDVYVQPGDAVKKGGKLARASQTDLEQKLHELRVELKKAEIALEDAQNSKKEGSLDSGSDGGAGQVKAEFDSQKAEAQAGADSLAAGIAQMEARITEIDTHTAEIDKQLEKLGKAPKEQAEEDGQAGEQQEEEPDERTALEKEKTVLAEEKTSLEAELSTARTALDEANSSISEIENAKNRQLDEIYKANNKQKQANALKMNGLDNAIELAQIDVDEAKTKIEQAEAALQNLELRADRDGVVLEVNYSAGMETTDEKALATIGDPEGLYARMQVAQADIGDIEEGQEVELRFDAFPELTFKGRVVKKQPTPVKDSNPVAYYVDTSVEMDGYALLSGMTCGAQFIIKQKKDVLMLSNKAIKAVDGKQVVLLKDEDGELYEQTVETGFSDGKFSEVLSGLSEGQTVYVEG